MNKPYIEAISTTVGTIVGGGILALPYAVSKVGFIYGLLLFAVIGFASVMVTMYTGELSSRFKKLHQLPVIVGRYTSERFKVLVLLFQLLTIYGAQVAYLTGMGLVLVFILKINYLLSVSIVFILTLPLIYKGYRNVESAETPLLFIKIIFIVLISIIAFSMFKPSNIYGSGGGALFGSFGIILFSLTGYTVIPEIKQEIDGDIPRLKKTIIYSYLISITIYIVFSAAFFGAFGQNVSQIATASLSTGYYSIVAAITTLFLLITPYIALSLVITDSLNLDFGISRGKSTIAALLFPFAVAMFALNFDVVLELTGGIFLSILSILVLLAVYNARVSDKNKPALLVRGGNYMLLITGAIMSLGLIYTLAQVI
ncbi:hypothetical protein M1293_01680 [Candidatus Parvarchaeota archaeon]|nr:hypothetical protein [Candidatus Parvarchaeota archaeon]